jgi:hypothetical protein
MTKDCNTFVSNLKSELNKILELPSRPRLKKLFVRLPSFLIFIGLLFSCKKVKAKIINESNLLIRYK